MKNERHRSGRRAVRGAAGTMLAGMVMTCVAAGAGTDGAKTKARCAGERAEAPAALELLGAPATCGHRMGSLGEVHGLDLETVKGLQKRAEQCTDHLEGIANAHTDEAGARALQLHRYLKSKAFQEGLAAEGQRLRSEIFADTLDEYGQSLGSEAHHPIGLEDRRRVYLFISESMPLETLRNYAGAIDGPERPKVTMVLRGFVGGIQKVLPTREFMLRVLRRDPECEFDGGGECALYNVPIVIDPLLFRRYGVEQVPTVVYAADVQIVGDGAGSEGLDENARVGRWVSISGDAGLDYLLERVNAEMKNR